MIEHTLPDMDEIRQMNTLDVVNLYRIEVHHLQKIAREEWSVYCERVRQGDQEARSRLLLHCLPYMFAKAFCIYEERRPAHIDILDLVGEANIIMLEKMDYALTKEQPIPYLFRIAIERMKHYCTYNAPLIQRPLGLNNQALARRQCYTTVNSLDASTIGDNEDGILLDRVQAPPLISMERASDESLHTRFCRLYEALDKLAPVQQKVIIQFYGLFDQPARTALELGKELHVSYWTINASKRAGLRRLKKLLTVSLKADQERSSD